jgi:hypothetical protein
VRRFRSSAKDVETSGEERLTGLRTGGWPRPPHNSEKGTELTGRDLAEIVELLECNLAWFGFRSVKVGPFIRVKDDTVSIDLIDRGDMLCRIELPALIGSNAPPDRFDPKMTLHHVAACLQTVF